MSLLKELREQANRESDPKVRRQRLAKIDEMESTVRDLEKRDAALKAELADLQSGRRRFFSWTEFVFGLGVVAVFAGAVYYQSWQGIAAIVVGIGLLVIAPIRLLRVKRRLKNLDKAA